MAIKPDLFLAILSLDAYNRGYDAGLTLPSSQTAIGDAQLLSVALPAGYQEKSFFAQAYALNGAAVISYRGDYENNLRTS